MDNVTNQAETVKTEVNKQSFSTNRQSLSTNKIIGLKYFIRSVIYLILFMGGYGLGIIIGTGQLASMKASQGVAGQDLTSPIFTGVTFQGNLISRNAGNVIVEKDGVELSLILEGDVSVFDLKSGGAAADKKIEDVPIGTNLTGSAVIKKDDKTSKYNLFVKSLIIN